MQAVEGNLGRVGQRKLWRVIWVGRSEQVVEGNLGRVVPQCKLWRVIYIWHCTHSCFSVGIVTTPSSPPTLSASIQAAVFCR